MERSRYNECYSLPDPCGSESRSTRYRTKKWMREQEMEQQATTVEGALDDCEAQSEPSVVTLHPAPADAVSSQPQLFEQPQLLEIEAFGFEVQSMSENDDEDSEICSTATSDNSDPPLYDGAPVTLGSSNLLILQHKMQHKLTDESLADLLRLLKLHLPTPNCSLSSVYYFMKHFCDVECPVKFHYFCSSCSQAIDDPSSNMCQNQICCSDLTQPGARSSFIQMPIEPQLQTLFCRE